MSDIYGVQPTGYVREPLSNILSRLEEKMRQEFGTGVVQTPQTPLGQLNGLMADLLAEIDERNLDLYQSYDPDQAEGVRLDILGRIRLLLRGASNDTNYRLGITNKGQAHIDLQDVEEALRGISGVTYAAMYTDAPELQPGVVAVAVIGGEDDEVATVLRDFIVPGISLYGNARVSSIIDGRCRTLSIIRPIVVPVELELTVRASEGPGACPPPSAASLAQAVIDGWMEVRNNGEDVSHFLIRGIIERLFPSIELVDMTGSRDGIPGAVNEAVSIGFIEIAELSSVEVTYL